MGRQKRSSDFTSSILARVNYGYRYIISITAGRELELLPPPIQRKIKPDDRYKVSIREDSIII